MCQTERGNTMITLDEAKKRALDHIGSGLKISGINELPGKWVFGFRNIETDEVPDFPPVYVMKEDGQTGEFFPPEHIAELPQMKLIEGGEA